MLVYMVKGFQLPKCSLLGILLDGETNSSFGGTGGAIGCKIKLLFTKNGRSGDYG